MPHSLRFRLLNPGNPGRMGHHHVGVWSAIHPDRTHARLGVLACTDTDLEGIRHLDGGPHLTVDWSDVDGDLQPFGWEAETAARLGPPEHVTRAIPCRIAGSIDVLRTEHLWTVETEHGSRTRYSITVDQHAASREELSRTRDVPVTVTVMGPGSSVRLATTPEERAQGIDHLIRAATRLAWRN